ncbi:hypothetical protein FHR32_003769 [Streptosporangium album]|uniref:Pyridoxamine 5'-phosphate oxidase N-terminal domain-containing protein n=1 Tax=Streptosporangium album TaxID=47479 RepID=A0A7W7WAT2_9ACTN|nr:pyridoxamine 5'-phosphate oxidase family protein [Streptosporangium album]MBB4939464.1 hypothetical protein [Streptosporangium album]
MQPNEITEVLNRPISRELLARDLTRLAYVAKDGTPRNVPIGFTWNGSEIVMCTAKNAPKLPALRKNPTVALTIDTGAFALRLEKRRSDAAGSGSPPCPSRLGREAAPCAHLWRLGVRGVFEVRQEMSRWDVENPRAASSPQ